MHFYILRDSLRDMAEVLFEQLIDVSLPIGNRGRRAAGRMERSFRKWDKALKKGWSHQKRKHGSISSRPFEISQTSVSSHDLS